MTRLEQLQRALHVLNRSAELRARHGEPREEPREEPLPAFLDHYPETVAEWAYFGVRARTEPAERVPAGPAPKNGHPVGSVWERDRW